MTEITAAGSISPLLDLVERWLRAERGVLVEEARIKKEMILKQKQQQEAAAAEKATKKANTSTYDPFAGPRRRQQINYW